MLAVADLSTRMDGKDETLQLDRACDGERRACVVTKCESHAVGNNRRSALGLQRVIVNAHPQVSVSPRVPVASCFITYRLRAVIR